MTKYSSTIKTIIAGFALALLGTSASAVEIRLKDEAHCAGPLVRLGDVAEVSPPEAEGASLADLALFPTPGTGKLLEVPRQELMQLLALCEVDLRAVQFAGAETVVIRAGSAEQKSIIRPALYLIPASGYVKKSPTKLDHQAGAAARPDELPKLVQRNQAVTIHSLWPGVKITASGKALADGTLGEAILIEQIGSRERVLAKVIGPQTVEVRPASK